MKDRFGHEWELAGTDHPFMTGWRCSLCGAGTSTHDGRMPADEPEGKAACSSALTHDHPEQVDLRKGQGDPVVMYLVVRESLSMSAGKVGAQCGHAVGMLDRQFFLWQLVRAKGPEGHHSKSEWRRMECVTELTPDEASMFELWDRTSFRKVVLKADEKEWKKLRASGLRQVVVRDSGLTEVEPGSETVIGVWPMLRSLAPKCVSRLQAL